MRLAALLQAGTSARQYLTLYLWSSPVTALPQPLLSCFIMEAPHKAPFCPCCHQPHFFSALILYVHLRRENTSKGKTRPEHREGWRMMRSQKKNPVFPDHAVWPCDTNRRVWVAWRCTRLSGALLYSYVICHTLCGSLLDSEKKQEQRKLFWNHLLPPRVKHRWVWYGG